VTLTLFRHFHADAAKVDGSWHNFNFLLAAPTPVSELYLVADEHKKSSQI